MRLEHGNKHWRRSRVEVEEVLVVFVVQELVEGCQGVGVVLLHRGDPR